MWAMSVSHVCIMTIQQAITLSVVVCAILFASWPTSAQECPSLFPPSAVAPSDAYNYSSPTFQSAFSSLNSSIGTFMAQNKIASYAVAVVHLNRTIFTAGLSSSLFRIASLTKTFTALGAFILRAQGRLLLDDPVKKFLPGFSVINPFGQHDTTLRELMGHASGLPQQFCPYGLSCTNNETEILQQIAGMHLIAPPWSDNPAYSNLGISLLGRAWEKATVPAQSWEDFVTDSILKPLRMTNTGVNLSDVELVPNSTPGAAADLGWSAPAAQMYSTADDLAKYLAFLLTSQPPLISETSMREWMSPACLFSDGLSGYSFPWELQKLSENSSDFLITKAGNINGFLAQLDFDPPTQVGVVVLTVFPQGSSAVLHDFVTNMMNTLLPAVESANQEMLAAVYAGVYHCRRSADFASPTLNYTVSLKEGTITVSVSPTVGLLADVDVSMLNAGQGVSTVGTWALLLKNATENSFWFGDGTSCNGIVGSVSSSPDLQNPNTPGSLYTDVLVFDQVKGSLQWPAVGASCYKSGSSGAHHSPSTFLAAVVFSAFFLLASIL